MNRIESNQTVQACLPYCTTACTCMYRINQSDVIVESWDSFLSYVVLFFFFPFPLFPKYKISPKTSKPLRCLSLPTGGSFNLQSRYNFKHFEAFLCHCIISIFNLNLFRILYHTVSLSRNAIEVVPSKDTYCTMLQIMFMIIISLWKYVYLCNLVQH